MLFLAHDLFYCSSGAKPVDYHSCRSFLLIFTFAGICLFVFLYYSTKSWDGGRKIISKIYDFLMWGWGFESGPEISLPPCILDSHRPFICSVLDLKYIYSYQVLNFLSHLGLENIESSRQKWMSRASAKVSDKDPMRRDIRLRFWYCYTKCIP